MECVFCGSKSVDELRRERETVDGRTLFDVRYSCNRCYGSWAAKTTRCDHVVGSGVNEFGVPVSLS